MEHKTMFFLLLILMVGHSTQAIANEILLNEEIPHHLYIDSLNECEDCTTYTIIISDKKVNKGISSAFKDISNSFGKKHAGAIIKWGEALKNFRFFKNHKCGSFTDMAERVVIYLDKNNNYCGRFPYDNEKQLIAMISIVSSNLGNPENIKVQDWGYKTKQAVNTYAKKNENVAPLKKFTFELIDYVMKSLTESKDK